jgi:hypothetical protein
MDPRFSSVVHEDLAALAFLLGAWRGAGEGEWGGGEPFRYGEEMSFEHTGEEFLLYSQRSWSLDDGSPLHFERGFLRAVGPGRIELVFAHPNGTAEVSEGTVSGQAIDVTSTTVPLTSTAGPVTGLSRSIRVEDGILSYELRMAMRGEALAFHVRGELART